jgi:chemotaxis protein histidine kinase CheA
MKSFEAELLEMRAEYVQESGTRLEQLRQLIEEVDGGADDQAIDPISRKFHAFTGSGRTYGFAAVTALGAEGEMLCDALRAAGVGPREALPCLRDLHHRLTTELAAPAR